jgi:phosphate/sulfate permease
MEETNKTTEKTVQNTEEKGAQVSSERYNAYGETEINLAELLLVYVRKWIILSIISIVAAGLVFIVVSKVLNKSAQKYQISFTFTYPGNENSLYPDGTTFSYFDFVQEENVREVLDKNPAKYSGFDVEKVLKNLIIERVYEENKDKEKIFTGAYIFTGIASYFGTSDVFREFTLALVENVADKIKDMSQTMYYYTFLDSFDSADTFATKLSYLQKQKDYIISFYNKWVEDYGQQYRAEYPILRYRGDVDSAFSADDFSKLNYELVKRQYTYNPENDEAKVLRIQIEILNDEHEDNEKKIQSLTGMLEELRKSEHGTQTDITSKSNETLYYERIAELTERQVDIDREIVKLNDRIKNITLTSESDTFLSKLNAVRATLSEQTTILRKVASYVYNDKTYGTFDSASFKSTGAKSAPLFAVLAFVVMYLGAGFIIFIVDTNEANKKEKK